MKKTNKKAYQFGKKVQNTDVFHLDLRNVTDPKEGIQRIMDFCDMLGAKYGHFHVVVDGGEGQQLHFVR